MRKYNRAFTIIELTLVLFIIALSLTVVFPKLTSSSYPRSMLRTSANRIAGIVEYAHQQAVCRRLKYFLNIDCNEGTYWISNQNKDGQIIPIKERLNLNGKLPEGVSFAGIKLFSENIDYQDLVAIRLSPNGWADPAEIILTCLSGETMSIIIDELSGQIKTGTTEGMK